ncbi:MAG: DNA methylase [Prevotella sp.]|nr:DNA methylase [Prevotella sp.]
MNPQRTYIAIDLKSFYASVECVERGLNPLTTNLVVADETRTEKTVCLAVTPPLKAYGIAGRARLFEVIQRVNEVNALRREKLQGKTFARSSFSAIELAARNDLEISYIVAPPRMAFYMKYSATIYGIYLKYIAPEDIHVYSVDEVFIDATNYLQTYRKTPRQLAMTMIKDVLAQTGITATAGIGTNLYLCKIAMDIVAKHAEPDADGVRIAELDELSFRQKLWSHEPLTDFWRIGQGTQARLAAAGITTMGQLARFSITNEALLYRLFGINAELLIDHAWGCEPCTIADIKAYRPKTNSLSSGQVLAEPYTFTKALAVVREMADNLALRLMDKGLATQQIVLTIGYDVENIRQKKYQGKTHIDRYGRQVPQHARGTTRLPRPTCLSAELITAVAALFEKIADRDLLVRRLNIVAANVLNFKGLQSRLRPSEGNLFDDPDIILEQQKAAARLTEKQRRAQQTVLDIRRKFGKNAILRGLNFAEGATAIERNKQIGGHKA